MLSSRSAGHRAKLVFTSDFHELVHGDLVGDTCILMYDPHRVVPAGEVSRLPATQRPVHIQVRYHPTGEIWEGEMRFQPGAPRLVDVDETGGGTMLNLSFPLPPGCDELEIWFWYDSESGERLWDSAGGKNIWIRFPAHDLKLQNAEIIKAPNAVTNLFRVEAESIGKVDAMTLRWRYTYPSGHPRQEVPLVAAAGADEKRTWRTPDDGVGVACGCTIAYDVVYFVGGRKFTDDNDGTWYLVT